jgi:hypothetical protein
MSNFYFQKGPVITYKNWTFPTDKQVDSFLEQYIPEFKSIFGTHSKYELYMIGSYGDRRYGNKQTCTIEPSYDVDFNIIMNGDEIPVSDEPKIYKALCSAYKMGFYNDILIDISSMKKPYFYNYDHTNYHYHKVINIWNNHYMYQLSPTIKYVNSFKFEHYQGGNKTDYLVQVRKQNTEGNKLNTKLQQGFHLYAPRRII